MKLKKAILQRNTYHSPDGKVQVTAERLRGWADTFNRMKSAGQVVPISWDHAETLDGVKPLSAADWERKRSAKTTVGRVLDFRVLPDDSGAEIELEITDPVAQGRAERNEVFVSPVILDSWRDGHGNEYADPITHVDMVNHPVDHSQGAFEPVETASIACALRMGLSTQIYKLGASDVADDDEDKDDDGIPAALDSDDSDPSEGAEDEDKSVDVGDDPAMLKGVIGALSQFNIVMPDDTHTGNFVDRLHTALLTAAAHKKEDQTEEPAVPTENPAVADPGFAAMSNDVRNAIGYAEKQHRRQVEVDLQSLLKDGKITPAEHKTHSTAIRAVKLSLDAQGEPIPSEVEKFIASRQPLPKGTFWSDVQRTQLSAAVVADPPRDPREGLTEEETKDKANWALGVKKK